MERIPCRPRDGFRDLVRSQGLVFDVTPVEDGPAVPYWAEDACYRFSEAEVDTLELVTEELHGMCLEAARFLATGAMGDLGLAPGSLESAAASLQEQPVSLYGRFDLRYDGQGPAQLLEYNADTPTGLVETAVVQWHWRQDVFPELDQWNSVHDRLVRAWRRAAPRLRSDVVHFAHYRVHAEQDWLEDGEEWVTVAYLRDTAIEAGLTTVGVAVDEIGWDGQRFVDRWDVPMDTVFKLYPWENMLREDFGRIVLDGHDATTWIEPVWKALLSNKALLAALWHLYPGHQNLLPAHLDGPGTLTEWIAKPLHGREGDGMRWVSRDGAGGSQAANWGEEGYCYQQWAPLPSYEGFHPVLGSWVVDGFPAGLMLREQRGLITDGLARFAPHVIDAPAPDAAQARQWLDRASAHD
jgi:glutathionylspermidine synthase